MNNKGFVLITSILIIFTMLGVLALLQLKTALHVRTTQAVARQMRSLALAETGVSRARGIIGSRDLDEILGGSPGEDPREYSILNPLDPLEARTSSLNRLRNPGDSRVYAIDAGEKELILSRPKSTVL